MHIDLPSSVVDQLLRGAGRRCSRCNAALTITRTLDAVQLSCTACRQTNIEVAIPDSALTLNPTNISIRTMPSASNISITPYQ